MYIPHDAAKRLASINPTACKVVSVEPMEELKLGNVPRCKRSLRDISKWLGTFMLFTDELFNVG